MRLRTFAAVLLAVSVMGLLAGGAGAQGDKKNPAAEPSPRLDKEKKPDPKWLKTHEGYVETAKKGGVDVLFLGDSITAGWRGNGKAVWEKHFAPLKAANFGIGGDRTEHVLWRLQNGELDGIKPKVAVLMIGTNNSGANSAAEIAGGITAIVKEIHKRSPETKVLLLAVFPRADKTGKQTVKAKLDEINTTVAKLDDRKTVHYLDIGGKFLKDGELTKEIMYDFLHLSPQGYEIWAAAITPTLQALLKDGKKN